MVGSDYEAFLTTGIQVPLGELEIWKVAILSRTEDEAGFKFILPHPGVDFAGQTFNIDSGVAVVRTRLDVPPDPSQLDVATLVVTRGAGSLPRLPNGNEQGLWVQWHSVDSSIAEGQTRLAHPGVYELLPDHTVVPLEP